MTIALIDGDTIVYRAAAAVEKTKYCVTSEVPPWDDNPGSWAVEFPESKAEVDEYYRGWTCWSRKEVGEFEDAKTKLDEYLTNIFAQVKPFEYCIFLTPPSGVFRDQIAKTKRYKGNRDGVARPFHYAGIREYICDRYGATVVQGHEAEDEISIRANALFLTGVDAYVVVGIDKDLLQIPGPHFDYLSNEHFAVSTTDARCALWMQVLMGDSTDNVAGCWRMGYQKSKNRVVEWIEKKKLSDAEIWNLVVEEYVLSQKYKDCPYKTGGRERAAEVAEETYWLVKLRTPIEEGPISWSQKTKTIKNKESDGQIGNQSRATSASASAENAGEEGKQECPFGHGKPVETATV